MKKTDLVEMRRALDEVIRMREETSRDLKEFKALNKNLIAGINFVNQLRQYIPLFEDLQSCVGFKTVKLADNYSIEVFIRGATEGLRGRYIDINHVNGFDQDNIRITIDDTNFKKSYTPNIKDKAADIPNLVSRLGLKENQTKIINALEEAIKIAFERKTKYLNGCIEENIAMYEHLNKVVNQ